MYLVIAVCCQRNLRKCVFKNFLYHLCSSKNDTPKQQSRKLRKLLRLQEKPKQKGKGGGFKLKKSLKEKSNKHKAMKPKGESFILKYFKYNIKLVGPVEAQVCCLSTAAVISASTLSSVMLFV